MRSRATHRIRREILSWLGDAFQVVALPVAVIAHHGSVVQMASAITAT